MNENKLSEFERLVLRVLRGCNQELVTYVTLLKFIRHDRDYRPTALLPQQTIEALAHLVSLGLVGTQVKNNKPRWLAITRQAANPKELDHV